MIRVVAIEDDHRYRASLEVLFRHAEDFELVRAFEAADIAFEALEKEIAAGGDPRWDLVLMDVDLPRLGGVEATRRMKERLAGVSVVVLTVFEDRAVVVDAICAGADGYLLKHTRGDELLTQLRSVMDGGSPLSAGVARTVLQLVRHLDGGRSRANERLDLSERELEVLRCLVQGMPYKQVATALGISIHTVRNHIRNIYAKLQVNSVAAAVSRALRDGVV